MKTKSKFLCMLLLVLWLPVALGSCSKDDDGKDNDSIAGTWKFKEAAAGEVKTNSTANDGKIKPAIVSAAAEDFKGSVITLREDGTFTAEEKRGTSTGTYTFTNGKLALTSTDAYTISGSVENGILTIEEDYTPYADGLLPDRLIALGISNPEDFTVDKAIVKISFSRQ